MTLILTTNQTDAIKKHAAAAYPDECCGALIGDLVGTARYAVEALPLSNLHEDGPSRRFRIEPSALLVVDRLSRKLGKSVIGFYHSHPDVANVPSDYDLAHAWETYSYLIVSVMNGEPKSMRSWVLEPLQRVFEEEKVSVSDCILETAGKSALGE